MFFLQPSILEKILRPLAIYVFLLVALRIGGQREIGQNNALQFVLLLSVANAVQNGIIGVDDSLTGAAIGAVTLFLANGFVELLASRHPRFHSLVIGKPIELVTGGVINKRTLRRQRLSIDDIMQAASRMGASTIENVDKAILNFDGDILITLKSSGTMPEQLRILTAKVDELLAKLNP
jgi:uncharacterized membrane protein YcaP (DUF421 family)